MTHITTKVEDKTSSNFSANFFLFSKFVTAAKCHGAGDVCQMLRSENQVLAIFWKLKTQKK